MLERTLIFVDTSYLVASFYNSWETGARSQLEIDLPEVVGVLNSLAKDQLHQPTHRQYWYDGIPESGPHRYQRALRSCDGVRLRTGQLIEWGERRTQKGVDTRLVADMVVAACQQKFSDFILVSGDADMIPGVEEAISHNVRVHLYGFGWDSMSSALRHACDTTTILDPREDFAEAMQLQILEGPLPPTFRERPMDDAEPLEEEGMTAVPPTDPTTAPLAAGSTALEAEAAAAEVLADQKETAQADMAKAADAEAKSAESKDSAAGKEPEVEEPTEAQVDKQQTMPKPGPSPSSSSGAPKPSMMAQRRRLRSRYVPLPEEVWSSAGFQTAFDVGEQYATWWYINAASSDQRDSAHLLSGGGLPPEIDRPLLQFACETLHEYTLSENQRVNLRDGFHSGIRGVLTDAKIKRDQE